MKSATRLFTLYGFCLLFSGCVTFFGPPPPEEVNKQEETTAAEPSSETKDERSFDTYIEDEKLESQISDLIDEAHDDFSDAHINIYCFNGIVLLTGEVPNKELQFLAGQAAHKSQKVRQVHNQLLIKSNANLYSRSYDTWIASKVRFKLMNLDDIESERVKVIVENQIVYIMGLLTKNEAVTVSEMAAKVSGVKKVVRVVEYI